MKKFIILVKKRSTKKLTSHIMCLSVCLCQWRVLCLLILLGKLFPNLTTSLKSKSPYFPCVNLIKYTVFLILTHKYLSKHCSISAAKRSYGAINHVYCISLQVKSPPYHSQDNFSRYTNNPIQNLIASISSNHVLNLLSKARLDTT